MDYTTLIKAEAVIFLLFMTRALVIVTYKRQTFYDDIAVAICSLGTPDDFFKPPE